jgi:hypothetical protein
MRKILSLSTCFFSLVDARIVHVADEPIHESKTAREREREAGVYDSLYAILVDHITGFAGVRYHTKSLYLCCTVHTPLLIPFAGRAIL